jgi:hypothetical protein
MRLSELKKLVAQLTAGGGGGAEAPHVVGSDGEPSYGSVWQTRYGVPAEFYKADVQAFMAGRVESTDWIGDEPIFILPETHRPENLHWFKVPCHDLTGGAMQQEAQVLIYATGEVKLTGAEAFQLVEVILDGINFRVAPTA